MFKLRYLPQYILALLLAILLFLEGWTYYLGTSAVTFERLIGSKPYHDIKDLSLRRYKENAFSWHLFTIETDETTQVINALKNACHLQKIAIESLPKEVAQTDKEMVEVIKKSPLIYLSKQYDLQHPKEGRMCLVFADTTHLYLFINGNL